ncbi:hypothetical protein [endosymbiont GvMRE of Glomus versiforme]|uniref:hypothetical protein n=1 Tax=endosymbiont GvMRE of Glomus versiforme TaxID=2039283 RepID=UPI000ECD7186|nr:hypothetical protein [endosymbiont GvMRE of Glomus versiforme]RHZ35987.1 hypothetical protein GvMRE_Ic3g55 [endosymbiont GvMRE of Glomus versiforme]
MEPKKDNGFWIELTETKGGLEKLSCQINGQHYIGFLGSKEHSKNGTTFSYKIARMRLCNWEKCSTCHSESELEEIF